MNRRELLQMGAMAVVLPVKPTIARLLIAPDDETARIQYESYGLSGLAILYEGRKYYDWRRTIGKRARMKGAQ